jgi:hypothetical protein
MEQDIKTFCANSLKFRFQRPEMQISIYSIHLYVHYMYTMHSPTYSHVEAAHFTAWMRQDSLAWDPRGNTTTCDNPDLICGTRYMYMYPCKHKLA